MKRFRLFDLRTPWLWVVVFYRKQYGEPMIEVSIFKEHSWRWWFSKPQWEDEPSRSGQVESSQEEWSESGERVKCSLGHSLALLLCIVAFALTATAQTFPRWPDNQTVKVFTLAGAFTSDEQGRIKAAVEAWRPLLPKGITLTLEGETTEAKTCFGCATLNREPTPRDKWGMTYTHYIGTQAIRQAVYATISIDRRAGSGDKFQRRVEHEFGHLFGLDHRPDSIMTERPHGKPGEGDAAILRMIYSSGLITRNDSKVSPPANRDIVAG